MKQPDFWKHNSLLSVVLLPFCILYSFISSIKYGFVKSNQISIPVICIGNVTIGGAGKTPTAIAIANMITAKGKKVVFLSRGYGGKLSGPLEVNNKTHTSKDVGDEPLLLSKVGSVIVAKNRFLGAQLAVKKGADVIIMDDGFQNPSLKKDISFLVFDGTYGIGNGKIIPAGPLRESLNSAMKRADAVIFIGDDKTNLKPKLHNKKILNAKIEPKPLKIEDKEFIAFAGIANPAKFFASLRQAGYKISDEISFPDHYNYSHKEIFSLLLRAEMEGCGLITTEKDYVRIDESQKKNIRTLPIEIVWENVDEVMEILSV